MTRRYLSPIVAALKEERERQGFSQRRFARVCGLAQQTISEVESGRRAATTVTLDRYIAGLGVRFNIVSVQSSHESTMAIEGNADAGTMAAVAASPTGQLDGVDGVGLGYASEFAYGVEHARHSRPLKRREHENGLGNSL